MKIHRVRSLEEFLKHRAKTGEEQAALRQYERAFEEGGRKEFTVPGFSYPARKQVDLLVDYKYSAAGKINWRERLVCPTTGLNNRLRASVHLLDTEIAPYKQDRIFISEQLTPLFQYLKGRYPNLVGSEFLGDGLKPGSLGANGIRHEDLRALSFADQSLDSILSFDCFEHIPEFCEVFAESFRVLRSGGKMLWSVPFVSNKQENTIRARLVKGEIQHLLPAEYHADPVSERGCLCYTHFGWEMLEQVRESGFRDCYGIPYSSLEFGYLGPEQIVFVAEK